MREVEVVISEDRLVKAGQMSPACPLPPHLPTAT